MTSKEEAPSTFWDELTSPLNLVLVGVILYLIYKILKSHFQSEDDTPAPPPQRMKKLRKDLTTAELKKYDGTGPDGRVLLAVNGVIFDVTRGKRFYGPGGPYSAFAGRDATRGLATGSVSAEDKEWDDVSDLNADEIASATEWEGQFREKYDIVGRLLKPGETPNKYSDDETEDKKDQ
ncbi:PREDICTED: membrane-associated progesterone receptor component 1-like [Papilio xuthus]|uniref:Membrane steroid binding protein n=1 Tax=Papilio xuthus TaxID=66420 RepID=I4DJ14_PAPXU|nr:membrane-associated progesterone receptor component 1-like [Papilio xuthus]BAM17904.1 membrane steroid binding protein [Papilio xuthus]